MEYADSLRKVLIRKITKAERDLAQIKLDYCRFVFGLSHRARVRVDGQLFLVRAVDVDSMPRLENGEFGKPAISGVPLGMNGVVGDSALVALGKDWQTVPESESLASR
jgi:hypothetical protein